MGGPFRKAMALLGSHPGLLWGSIKGRVAARAPWRHGLTEGRVRGGIRFEFPLDADPDIRLMLHGGYEAFTMRALRRCLAPGDTFVDVGANIGYLSAVAAGIVGPTGAVHSFEPVPRLFERLERPVITDLRLEWPSGLRADAWPNPLPDLYAGEPLLVTARVSALKGNLKISGNIAGRPWKHTLALAGAKKGSGVSKFWARNKIASLEARRFSGQRASDVGMAIEAVALEHGLVSRMTRIVALDVTPLRSNFACCGGFPTSVSVQWRKSPGQEKASDARCSVLRAGSPAAWRWIEANAIWPGRPTSCSTGISKPSGNCLR